MTESEVKNESAKVNGEEETKTADKDQQAAAETGAGDSPASPPVKEMRAVVLTAFGGLKSVKIQNKPEPSVKDGEVLIRVKACGLNFLDLMMRQGAIDNQPKTPFILGFECAGEIEAAGEGVGQLAVGDRVFAFAEVGAWAELVTVSSKFVYKLPDNLNYKDAIGVTLTTVVAQALLFDIGNLRSGQTVLLQSVGGGVGQAVAQLAKTVPNVTVIGTASASKHDSIKESVNHLIDNSVDYVQEVKKISPEGVDLVLDCLCGDEANKGFNLLKPMGRYILYGRSKLVAGESKSLFGHAKLWWQVDKVNPIKLFDDNKTVSGFNLRRLLYQQNGHEYVRKLVEQAFVLFGDNKISPVIDSSWAFEDVAEAMQKMHDRKNVGKIVLDPAQEAKPRPVEEETVKSKKSKSKDKGDGDKKEKEPEKKEKEIEANGDAKDEKVEEKNGDAK
ncbi:Synaptic vesicle membrane protein VAT-1 -like protein-like [Halotydeus destructor]|nr:Synaptic vesicle membrane protein VAT-1 -like protein-like [Halotydeus destructor]